MKRLALLPLALAAMTLAGCAASATPESIPSSTATGQPTPTASATPTPEPVVAEAIVVGVDGFDVVADSGEVLFSHDWPDEIPAAVAELTAVFDSEPVITERSTGNTHFPDYREYTWPGFQLDDAITLEVPRTEYFRPSGVYVTVPEVNGIRVVSEIGPGVGSTYDDLLTVSIDQATYEGSSSFLLATGESGGSLSVSGDDSTGLITSLGSPGAWGL